MNPRTFKDDFLLLLTAAIWGFAFVAQRAGMEYIQPSTYNGVRFALGSLFWTAYMMLIGCALMLAGMIVSQTSLLRNPAAVGSGVPRP
jgi:hypothetical protein